LQSKDQWKWIFRWWWNKRWRCCSYSC